MQKVIFFAQVFAVLPRISSCPS